MNLEVWQCDTIRTFALRKLECGWSLCHYNEWASDSRENHPLHSWLTHQRQGGSLAYSLSLSRFEALPIGLWFQNSATQAYRSLYYMCHYTYDSNGNTFFLAQLLHFDAVLRRYKVYFSSWNEPRNRFLSYLSHLEGCSIYPRVHCQPASNRHRMYKNMPPQNQSSQNIYFSYA